MTESQALSPAHFRRVMKPLIRFFLKHALPFREFMQIAKSVYVEVADEELRKVTKKVNASRISAMTGIHRIDVTQELSGEKPAGGELGLVGRIMGQWENDKRFHDDQGKPKALTFKGEGSEFQKLILKVSQHLHQGTILFEMERKGFIEKTKDGKVKLIGGAQVLTGDVERSFDVLARDVDTLFRVDEENIAKANEIKNLHVHTEYDNIIPDKESEIRNWLLEEGRAFHKRARDFLSQFDRDINPDIESAGAGKIKVSLTSFGWSSKG